jgi:magnesium chelatase family protein
MLSKVFSATICGIDAFLVPVEVSFRKGLRKILLVGLPDTAVRESKERVIAAIINSGFALPRKTITVNLAPAELKKQGAGFDLPIALAILASEGELEHKKLHDFLIVGELSLDSSIRPINGMLSIASNAAKMGFTKLIVPAENAQEASYVKGITIYPFRSLHQAVLFLKGIEKNNPYPATDYLLLKHENKNSLDMRDVRGQHYAKRALEVAVAGGHNILLIGPPGSGKTLMAQRLPSIMPPLTWNEAIETTKIHSIARILNENGILLDRPFRAPHHTISYAGLTGGGQIPKPGEISLAHNGVLFLDEFLEFPRNVLENLRQPIEDGFIRISRASFSVVYPARFMLVAAMNPCPCGYFTDTQKMCKCTPYEVKKYMARISGPLLDRIDIHISLPPVRSDDLMKRIPDGESSQQICERVIAARKIQLDRLLNEQIYTNAQLLPKHLDKYCLLSKECQMLMHNAMKTMHLTARAFHRIIRVARTIADLQLSSDINECHLAEAIQYRSLDSFLSS